jgi:uncharacterized protein (DUF1501 family)
VKTDRRKFLQQATTVVSIGVTTPLLWQHAAVRAATSGANSSKILVVVQLTGGNDGLNMVIPSGDPDYYRLRPSLAIGKERTLSLASGIGWHPAMGGLAELTERSEVAVVQGVGYPQPNRSHFESMDIWHTCYRKSNRLNTGWLGRWADELSRTDKASDVVAMHLGTEKQPLALAAERTRIPTIAALDEFRLHGGGSGIVQDTIESFANSGRNAAGDMLDFIRTTTQSALVTSNQLARLDDMTRVPETFPSTPLGDKLKLVFQLIDAELPTRVYYVSLDGFDTHAKQAPAHEGLLRQFSDAVAAFQKSLAAAGLADKVLTLAFSEFGRRVAENASGGTDHGAAAPVLLVGPRVRAGLVGEHPPLTELDDGDLKFHTDFRQVYAAVLRNWLQWNPDAILGESFTPVDVIA